MQYVVRNGVKIWYPDQQVFLWDEINFALEGPTGSRIGYNLSLLNYGPTHESRTLSYQSGFSNKISVPIGEAVRSIYNDAGIDGGGHCGMTAVLTIYLNGQRLQEMWTWHMDVMEGRTMSYKIHGGNKIIHIYSQDELGSLQIYSDEVCDLYIGTQQFHIFKGLNVLDLASVISAPGVYSLCFTQGTGGAVEIVSVMDITPSSATIYLQYQTAGSDEGDVRKDNIYKADDLKNCYFIVYGWGMSWHNGQLCESQTGDGEYIELRYRDTDGSRRYLGGRIMSDELEYEGMRYNRLDPMMLFKKPLRHVQSHETSLTVGMADLERASGFDEILLSGIVEMRCKATLNQWVPCIIEDSIVRNSGEDRYDVELQIKVS